MKVGYKGHTISVTRERCMGGWPLIYYGIYRDSDGYECAAGFTEEAVSVATYMGYMRERVDAELATDDPWCEREDVL